MLVEFYNQNGDLILDNETKVFKVVQKLKLPGGAYIGYPNRNTPNSWYSDWNISGRTANGSASVNHYAGPYYTGTLVPAEFTFIRPLNGTTTSSSYNLDTVGVSNNATVVGEGVEYARLAQTQANDASGYLDCFNINGELVWSVSSLISSPQILKVINNSTTRSIDLTEFNLDIREKIYFLPLFEGDYDVPDESTAYYSSVNFTRVGNIVYIGNLDGNGATSAYILVALIH